MRPQTVLLMCTVACLMTASEAAMAQEVPAAQDTGEIVVTAQKRAQNVQDIGLSVTALGADSLSVLGRQDVTALAALVPSLQVNQSSPTTTVFNIRGVSQNDFADSQEAPIAFYSDEVYISALGAISGMTFDLDRIEVLRGPQGTLFGRNATGGLIQVVSARPTRSFEGFVTGTVGSYGQFATEGAISGPLTDRLRGRISFTTNNGGDYIQNRVGPDLGGSKFYAGRIQLAADIGATGLLTLKAQALRNDNDHQANLYGHRSAFPNAQGLGEYIPANANPWGTCNGCDAYGYIEPDNSPFTASYNSPFYFGRTFWSVTGRYEQDFGGVKLTSITDYQKLIKRYADDSDTSPSTLFNYITYQNLEQISQEVRLAGDTDRLHWLLGVYGIRIKSQNDYVTDATGAFGLLTQYGGLLETKSLAGFGQLEYKLTDQFSVIGGARYSYDWKTYDFVHRSNGDVDLAFNRSTYPDLAKLYAGDYSGKVELDYKPTHDILVYASINRGIKSGGFGTPAIPPIDPTTIPFGNETLTNYEGGVKLTLFDKTTHLKLSGFHYNYKNYQSFELSGLAVVVKNKQAYVNGLEAELNSHPVRGLYLQTNLTILDTKVKDVVLPNGDVVDRRMPQAPKLSLSALVRYEFQAGPGQLALQTNWKYDSAQYFSTFNAPVDLQRGRVFGDARISYQFDKLPLEAAFFVNNVTDKRYLIYNLDLSGPLGITQQTFARPRWFGGSMTVRFR